MLNPIIQPRSALAQVETIPCPLCEAGYPKLPSPFLSLKELDENGNHTGRYIQLKRSTYEKIKLAVEEALDDSEIDIEIYNL